MHDIYNAVSLCPYYHLMLLFAARTQAIILNATPDMLKEHILPVAEKLKDNAKKIEREETEYLQGRRRHVEPGESEAKLQEVG